MFKCKSEELARKLCRDENERRPLGCGVFYGMSAIDGQWYVGTSVQLDKIGVVTDAYSISGISKRDGQWCDDLAHFPTRDQAELSRNRLTESSRSHEAFIVVAK